MFIENEASLVDEFIQVISKKDCRIIYKEMRTNYGRPDVVVVDFDKNIINKRKPKKVDVQFTKTMGYIMTYLYHRRWVKISTVQEFLSCGDKELKDSIESLVNLNLVEINDIYIKSRSGAEILAVKRMWVYEAKLSNWKCAVEQAERHLWFTFDSYVLLPEVSEYVLNKSINECKFRDIGLSLFLKDRSINTEVKSTKQGILNTPLLWEVNEKIVRSEIYCE